MAHRRPLDTPGTPGTPGTPSIPDSADTPASPDNKGLDFDVARSQQAVIDAWRLVYKTYIASGLISPNPFEIHTTPHAILNPSTVICGKLGQQTVITMSACVDGPAGLSLDAVYSQQLDELRRQGRKLCEIGLFADRRREPNRSRCHILELIRYATYFGLHQGATDGVIGVHPRHVKFYARLLNFEIVGPQKSYSLVNDHPVVLLSLDWQSQTTASRIPRSLAGLATTALPPEAFHRRFILSSDSIAGSVIEQYLAAQKKRETAA